jgi:WD40 repeat protein
MKQLFIITMFMFLLALKAQEPYEYPYNPLITMSRDGLIIAVSGRSMDDSTARLGFRAPVDFYDATSGNLLGSFAGSEDAIAGLALNADGSLLAYSNTTGRLGIVDVQKGLEENLIEVGGVIEIGYPVWSPEETVIATFSGRALEIYDALRPWYEVSSYYDEATGSVLGFDWSEDSNIIAYSANSNESSDGILVILRIGEDFGMELLKTIDAPSSVTVAMSDDGSSVAISAEDGVLVTIIDDEHQFCYPL